MASPVEAERYIRFQLEHLSATNEHHTFELICYRIAQRRLSSNVIPATGPVAAGGDQGRDVETYYTSLPEELPGAGGFIGRATTKPLVVACTVQKDRLADKVRADLKKICGTGVRPARIAFFAVHEIPVAIRHRLQRHATKTYGVSLEVFDGQAIAGFLTEGDLNWVAQRYLDVPSEMLAYETVETQPEWYTRTLQVLRARESPRLTHGSFSEVRDGIRHAVAEADATPDLPEWIGYMREFLAEGLGSDLTVRARYEVIVATFKCMNTLDGLENEIRAVLEEGLSSEVPSIVDDAASLLMYWGGAYTRHIGAVEAVELDSWNSRLRAHVRELLTTVDVGERPNLRARLLSTLAFLCLQPAWTRVPRPAPGAVPSPSETAALIQTMKDRDEDFTVDASVGGIDVTDAMDVLAELASLLPDASVFALGTVGSLFQMFAPSLSDDPRYTAVRDALDEATARVEGDAVVAERSRARASAFLTAQRPLQALRELHAAKAAWWHGETLRGATLTMLMIAEVYRDLRLAYAAKQYALAAALIATIEEDLSDLAPRALISGMNCSYDAGAWADSLAVANLAARAHYIFAEDAFDDDAHPELRAMDLSSATILLAAERFRPELQPTLSEALGDSGYEVRIDAVVSAGRGAFAYTEDEFVALTDAQLAGRPFSDFGPRRRLQFAAIGTTWSITCTNERSAVLATERLSAGVQILLSDLALDDPGLMPQDVVVDVVIGTPLHGSSNVRFKANNTALECTVILSAHEPTSDLQALSVELTAILFEIVSRLTTRSQREVAAMIESSFAAGLPHKLHVVRPYDEVAGLLAASHYQHLSGITTPTMGTTPFTPVAATELLPPTSPGRGYDQRRALDFIRENYEYLPGLVAFTLSRALNDTVTREGLQQLRAEGWLDWQLLLTIVNAAANFRLGEAGASRGRLPTRQRADAIVRSPETTRSTDIPLELLAPDALRFQWDITLFSVAKRRWGIEPTVDTPNSLALRRLLTQRYGLMTDDVPHRDLFTELFNDEGDVVPLIDGHGAIDVRGPEGAPDELEDTAPPTEGSL